MRGLGKKRYAAFIGAIALLVALPAIAIASGSFTDVPPDHIFYDDVEWMASEGITDGCNPPDNTLYCPDEAVTRGEVAKFLHRAISTVPEGPEGPEGPQGPTGDPGVSGLQIYSAESPTNSTTKSVSVDCPDGKLLTGGGGVISHANRAQITSSWPNDANTWTVDALDDSGDDWSVLAYAICATVPAP
jgi:hypothetical protein